MLLNNRYQLQEPIGRGGMATIYRGWDTQMQRSVAIKVLREVFNRDPKFVRRFHKESELIYSLHHSNIVQVKPRHAWWLSRTFDDSGMCPP